MARRVVVVPHTHWDREWYEPFQSFRMRLVDTLGALLDLLERDPSYRSFLLDGQMAMVDDYLEVRPEDEERIRRLAVAGRLEVGPWYVLMDEFLVSGETIVRNLELGLARAAAFGGAMAVGYLPDMFGHVAQMPQILRLAGMEHAVVWRGVPRAVERDAFIWVAPDGSRVRAQYLVTGYGNGSALPDDAKALVARVRDHLDEVGSFVQGDLLFMNGTDHEAPQPWLGRVLAEANTLQEELRFEVSRLGDFLAHQPYEGLPRVEGELRSGARANVLMGVASNRVDVKRAEAAATRTLEQRAEPLAALFLPPDRWPERLLELAWRRVVQNAAHDSVCACSVDDVVDAVLARYAEARQVAEGVAERAKQALAASLAEAGTYVVNPCAATRAGVVEVVVPAEETPTEGVQVLSERTGLPGSMTLDANTVRSLLDMIQSPQIDAETFVEDVVIGEDEEGIEVTVRVGETRRRELALVPLKREVLRRLEARPDAPVRVRLDQVATRRVLVRTAEVPGFGWARLAGRRPANPAVLEERANGTVAIGNGLIEVVANPENATFACFGIEGMGRLVDGGDCGDSYNYSPPVADTLVDQPTSVVVEPLERGPVRASLQVVAHYRWPKAAARDRSRRLTDREVEVEVRTRLEVLADDPALRVLTTFVNPCRFLVLRIAPSRRAPLAPSSAGSRPRGALRSSGSPPSQRAASCRRAISRWSTTHSWNTSSSTSGARPRAQGPTSSRSRCFAPRGCSRAWAWPTDPCPQGR
jgi:mannosylglycerate hydrolase